MTIYTKKNNERIITSTIRIDPDCYIGDKLIKFRASIEKTRLFYVHELMADQGPDEITLTLQAILHPELTIRPLWQLERDAIFDAVTFFKRDTEAAAAALEITRSALFTKLCQYKAMPEHPLYLKMRQAIRVKGSSNEAESQEQERRSYKEAN